MADYTRPRHRADVVLENLGFMRGGRVTRHMRNVVDDVVAETRRRRAPGGESYQLSDVLADVDAACRKSQQRKDILVKLGLKGTGEDEEDCKANRPGSVPEPAKSSSVSQSVRDKLREKFGCAPNETDEDCFKPMQSTKIENVVRTGVSTAATVDLRTLMSSRTGTGAQSGGDFDHFKNVFYLVECFPKFVEEYNFIMQTLFHCPKMPSTQFYEGLVKFGIEDKLQYFRMSDQERATIWDGWTEEGPKKPRRRAEIDFFNLVTDPSVTNGAVLKMPHPENRVVLRGANLIIDSRNTDHHFYARVFSRGSGRNNVVNNIVFNKLTKRVEMDSDVRKTHLPDRSPNQDMELCDDELPEAIEEDPLAAFRCPGSRNPRAVVCNY